MKLCIIGTGYVGLVTGTCFAEMGNNVICVDIDETKIAMLNRGEVPIYEPGLKEMIDTNSAAGRITFTTGLKDAVQRSEIIFIAVGTPADEDGSADLSHVIDVSKSIAQYVNEPKIIVTKSTVPVGTADLVKQTIKARMKELDNVHEFTIVSNPEFLKEGAAIDDFMKPDRVILGVEDEEAAKIMKELYEPFSRGAERILVMNIRSAEMTKYASNAFLATKISFMNELSHLCESLDADISEVRHGMGSDTRIGHKFIFPGVGYGGSCFPKDVRALISMHSDAGTSARIIQAVEETNQSQKMVLVDKLVKLWGEDMSGKTIAIWGLAFKPQTDDMREAPATVIINALLGMGATIQAYDPIAIPTAKKVFANTDNITFVESEYDALEGADAMLLVTEWHIFRLPDWQKMKGLMKQPLILDGRNQYEPQTMRELGFEYHSIGRAKA
ncbi:MAG TPA: UDP-glucose/GDP-mannose dehydrogenase family protein [Candidatus Cloacimonetes bacterium]|jgi:UDPglucose 6-dehydrogenase|nr:UDP-glucose 6-dehydrogenase [Candidatus Cloacimonas sp.]HHZ14864.1 UDP-glucose/GDP-mannose dehydrogenase family protein [Candidatus Cloacimonadota bacterium]